MSSKSVKLVVVLGVMVLGMGCKSKGFHKQWGISEVMWHFGESRGYDSAAKWHTEQAYVVTDSASQEGHWGVDTVYEIHRYDPDTLKVNGVAVIDSLTKKPIIHLKSTLLGTLPANYIPLHH